MSKLYFLDTNILVNLVRNDATGQYLKRTYGLLTIEPRPLISSVTEGELRSLALQWKWGEPKKEQMNFFLSFFWRMPIEKPEVFEAYATIDAWCEERGVSMGKNDLWVAASAHVFQARLLTTDKDFGILQPSFLERDFINPSGTR